MCSAWLAAGRNLRVGARRRQRPRRQRRVDRRRAGCSAARRDAADCARTRLRRSPRPACAAAAPDRRAAASPAATVHRTPAPRRPAGFCCASAAMRSGVRPCHARPWCPAPKSASTAARYPCSRGVFAFAARACGVGPSLASAACAACHIFVKPQRLIEGHRLAPVRQRKRRIDLLRGAKRVDGLFVAEAMQPQHAANEVRLRRRRAGVRKRDRAERRRACAAGAAASRPRTSTRHGITTTTALDNRGREKPRETIADSVTRSRTPALPSAQRPFPRVSAATALAPPKEKGARNERPFRDPERRSRAASRRREARGRLERDPEHHLRQALEARLRADLTESG